MESDSDFKENARSSTFDEERPLLEVSTVASTRPRGNEYRSRSAIDVDANGHIQNYGSGYSVALSEEIEEEATAGSVPWYRRNLFSCVSARHVLAVMTCLGFVNVYALRVNLSVAVVEMDNRTATIHGRHGAEVFFWTPSQEGWVLSSFFIGYILTQLPGGWLATRFGGKWVYGVGILMTSVLTLLTPMAAQLNIWALVAIRIMEGFFEGVTFPAVYAMWGKWAPPLERSKLMVVSASGQYIGNVISFPLSALLCQYGFDGGWPSVFYVFGAIGFCWFILWIFLGYSSPADHPRISKEEREYIEDSIAAEGVIKEEVTVPWLQLFTSPALLAIGIASLCNNWGFYTLLTCLPTYLDQALETRIGIVMNGVYSAIPYFFLTVTVLSAGQLADFLRARWLSTVAVRKGFTAISFFFGAFFLLLQGYFGESLTVSITIVTLAVSLNGMAASGYGVNHVDISPKFAGYLMGITNTMGTIPGIVAPIVAKAIALPPPDGIPKGSWEYAKIYKEEWREVFTIAAEVYVFGALIYLILASGEKQPWAEGKRKRVTVYRSIQDNDLEVTNSLKNHSVQY